MAESKASPLSYDCIPAFRFCVSFNTVNGETIEMGFSEVSGLNAELQTEEVTDGCALLSSYKLPKPIKFPNLVLKKALGVSSHGLIKWIDEAIYSFIFKPCTVNVSLCKAGETYEDGSQEVIILKAWALNNAYPVKVQLSEFSSTKNELVIETLELAYRELKRLK